MRRPWRVAVSAVLLVVAACGGGRDGSTATTVLPNPDATRLAGRSDAETAAMVSAVRFATASDVMIATKGALGLALGASYAAGSHQSPILLVERETVPDATMQEIERLKAYNARILGGPAAIGTEVDEQLRKAGLTVERIDASDVYRAAVGVASSSGTANVGVYPSKGRTVFLASAAQPVAALVAGPLAFGQQWPILLTDHDQLPPDTRDGLTALQVQHVIVVGDESAISRGVADDLAALGLSVERIGGPTPVATAAALAGLYERIGLPPPTSVEVVGAESLVDALVAGPHAGPASPILLCATRDDCGPETSGWLTAHRASVARVVVVGRPTMVSDGAKHALDAAAA